MTCQSAYKMCNSTVRHLINGARRLPSSIIILMAFQYLFIFVQTDPIIFIIFDGYDNYHINNIC